MISWYKAIKAYLKKEKVYVNCPYDSCTPLDSMGKRVRFTGWNLFPGGDPKPGQYAIVWHKWSNGPESCYKIEKFNRYSDPRDMWTLVGTFSPR